MFYRLAKLTLCGGAKLTLTVKINRGRWTAVCDDTYGTNAPRLWMKLDKISQSSTNLDLNMCIHPINIHDKSFVDTIA